MAPAHESRTGALGLSVEVDEVYARCRVLIATIFCFVFFLHTLPIHVLLFVERTSYSSFGWPVLVLRYHHSAFPLSTYSFLLVIPSFTLAILVIPLFSFDQ